MPDHHPAASAPIEAAGHTAQGAAGDDAAARALPAPDDATEAAGAEAVGATEPDAGQHRSGGYSTAELLGNAALAVGALVAIWAALQGLGEDIVEWIGSQLMGG